MKTIAAMMLLLAASLQPAAGASSSIDWREWNPAAFAEARREGRFVLLDLVAVWCHWCHVMDAKTYSDPAVQALISQHFVPVQADHDKRPDLAERYREWGWPATIILAADGTEIVKRAGYIDADAMGRLLRAVVDDPSPEAGSSPLPARLSASAQLDRLTRERLERRHVETHDGDLGGLRSGQKFVERDSVEWDLTLAARGDTAAERRARRTLDAGLALIDPAFGGVYQYSTHGDWAHPHYEKIIVSQAGYIRLYAQAARELGEPRYRQAVDDVVRYLDDFLTSPDGAFYTSQDADLVQGTKGHEYFALGREARLAQGVPRIDKHRYARHNGLLIEALADAARDLKDPNLLARADRAARWIIAERPLWGGGFRHDRLDAAGPYLGDTLAMGAAFLALHRTTGDAGWLKRASRAAQFIDRNFRHDGGGLNAAVDNGTPVAPAPQLDENLAAARFVLDLAALTQAAEHRELATHVLRYLVTPEVALSRLTEAGVLLAADAFERLPRIPGG
ncbi:MAG: thioredoxin domain-containing protein [Chromatiales bacterium]|nr:thioredoxin domain-containing protein [Chromatiales bacterium]